MARTILKNWQLQFEKSRGMENCGKVMKSFAAFFVNRSENSMDVPGDTSFSGNVYNRPGIPDGSEIFTSYVKKIERVDRGDIYGTPHDLMCATTKSGSEYYFYSDEVSPDMFLMLGAVIHGA